MGPRPALPLSISREQGQGPLSMGWIPLPRPRPLFMLTWQLPTPAPALHLLLLTFGSWLPYFCGFVPLSGETQLRAILGETRGCYFGDLSWGRGDRLRAPSVARAETAEESLGALCLNFPSLGPPLCHLQPYGDRNLEDKIREQVACLWEAERPDADSAPSPCLSIPLPPGSPPSSSTPPLAKKPQSRAPLGQPLNERR